MKRIISLILALTLLFSLGITAAAAEQRIEDKELYYREVSIFVNGTELVPQDVNGNATEPFIIEGTTYLPVRALAGALGLKVDWDGDTNTITLTSGADVNMGSGQAVRTRKIVAEKVYYKNVTIILDGKELIPMDVTGKVVEPFLMGGSTYLPLRAIAGALGLDVAWDEASNTITLVKPEDSADMVWRLVKQTATTSMGSTKLVMETEYLYDAAGRFLGMFMSLDEFRILDLNCSYSDTGKLASLSLLTEDQWMELSFAYSAKGLPESISAVVNDEFLAKITYEYDQQGRISKEITESADGSAITCVYSYSENPNVTTIVAYDALQQVLWNSQILNDADGNLLREFTRYADGSSEEALWTYDVWGNQKSYTFRSNELELSYTYEYDTQGREIGCTMWMDGSLSTTATEWSVDGLSCRITTTESDGSRSTESRIFSEDGRLLSSTLNQGGVIVTTEYEYAQYPCSEEDEFISQLLDALGYSK